MGTRAGLALGLAGAAAIVAVAAAVAQTAPSNATVGPPTLAPPAPASSETNAAALPTLEPPPPVNEVEAEPPKPTPAKVAAAKPPPPGPAKPVRSSTAYLRALDKVTAETIMFAAPVGQPVRYKNLVITVKACETMGVGEPSPEASAYLIIDEAPLGAEGIAPPPPRRVFDGWMFANSPGLNPLQHPVYDAWLIACMAPSPPA